ncbi:unnamed protein product [Lactuca virosa]|uniref:Uncharacterized protein n=1 Tax=Lactuca virosa TaxID=75947 RepID=A0AAU9NSB2_9ASTR|nr:unnamed protein product [Lactuca virosa]
MGVFFPDLTQTTVTPLSLTFAPSSFVPTQEGPNSIHEAGGLKTEAAPFLPLDRKAKENPNIIVDSPLWPSPFLIRHYVLILTLNR